MGRATIVSGGANGRYTIALDYGTAERDARVAKFDAKIAEMEDRATATRAGRRISRRA